MDCSATVFHRLLKVAPDLDFSGIEAFHRVVRKLKMDTAFKKTFAVV